MNSQAFCIVRRQETIRSLPGRPSGLYPYLPPEGQTILAFLPHSVPEIALLICRSLYSPGGVPFGPSVIVPDAAYLFLRLSAFWSASLSSPTAGPTLPSADFCDTIRVNLFILSPVV